MRKYCSDWLTILPKSEYVGNGSPKGGGKLERGEGGWGRDTLHRVHSQIA